MSEVAALDALVAAVRACTRCAAHLPHGPRPVVQVHPDARILIAAQAPGRKVHASGIPFDDASGERLRTWMGITREAFYDASRIAILPMGFCYPGTGASGDLPPRAECAPAWRASLLAQLTSVELTLVIGRFAQEYHLKASGRTLTDAVRQWKEGWPSILALPHPSPRNNPWIKRNPWFEQEVVPELRERIRDLLPQASK
ncbi:MAG: uracil-DNA glycosylase family protein [Gemmatimonadaceae bacterium]